MSGDCSATALDKVIEGWRPITVRAPATLAAVDGARRLAIATTRVAVIDHGEFFSERQVCPNAFELVGKGLVPVLAEHWDRKSGEGWNIETQLGIVREARFTDDRRAIELLLLWSSNPRGAWIWQDLCAGIAFGCSIQISMLGLQEGAGATLPKPYYRTSEWLLREVTICAAQGGCDQLATLRMATNLAELEAELRAVREEREAAAAAALPEYLAEPLRRRLPEMAAAISHQTGADPKTVLAALHREIGAYVADCRHG